MAKNGLLILISYLISFRKNIYQTNALFAQFLNFWLKFTLQITKFIERIFIELYSPPKAQNIDFPGKRA